MHLEEFHGVPRPKTVPTKLNTVSFIFFSQMEKNIHFTEIYAGHGVFEESPQLRKMAVTVSEVKWDTFLSRPMSQR